MRHSISTTHPKFCTQCGNRFPTYSKLVENHYRYCSKCEKPVNWNPEPFPSHVDLGFAEEPIKKNNRRINAKTVKLPKILDTYFGTTRKSLISGSLLLGSGAFCLWLAPLCMAGYLALLPIAATATIWTGVGALLILMNKDRNADSSEIILGAMLVPGVLFGTAFALFLAASALPFIGGVLMLLGGTALALTARSCLMEAHSNGSLDSFAAKVSSVLQIIAKPVCYAIGFTSGFVLSLFSWNSNPKIQQHTK